jgi:hypothetical protein
MYAVIVQRAEIGVELVSLQVVAPKTARAPDTRQ